MSRSPVTSAELFAAARGGDRRALGRLVTLVERGGPAADEVSGLAHPHAGSAHVVGITGAPGAGKSTLTGVLAASASEAARSVAVVAIDPTSPLTGGAILGDRIRMDEVAPGAFIRSMASRGESGGLSLAVPGVVRLLDAVGHDLVIVETVGVGQVEVAIVGATDTAVVVVTPGWGDAVQANKAGLLEVADVFVVNKADRLGAADTRRDLELMLDLSGPAEWRAPIVTTTATTGEGLDALVGAIDDHRAWLGESQRLAARRAARLAAEVRSHARHLLDEQLDARIAEAGDLLAAVAAREVTPGEAARRLAPG